MIGAQRRRHVLAWGVLPVALLAALAWALTSRPEASAPEPGTPVGEVGP